jgi:hypothetical protein
MEFAVEQPHLNNLALHVAREHQLGAHEDFYFLPVKPESIHH